MDVGARATGQIEIDVEAAIEIRAQARQAIAVVHGVVRQIKYPRVRVAVGREGDGDQALIVRLRVADIGADESAGIRTAERGDTRDGNRVRGTSADTQGKTELQRQQGFSARDLVVGCRLCRSWGAGYHAGGRING